MYKTVIKEVLVWLISILIAAIVWAPIFLQLPYKYLPLGITTVVLIIQFCRWFVSYDRVVLFQHKYLKLLLICLLFLGAFVIWAEGQKILLVTENMEIKDIIADGKKVVSLSSQGTYQLFRYLKNLLIFSNYGAAGLAFVLILKIIYKSLGIDKR